ncbi:MAG: M4 family metallopeptidase [Acidobacteria bacterium]|nr:M4 family metallopeptidase [Acidobacteriota bacterium]MCA1610764.1 M4 family metallopeptidase [Acidobacteriota bacterium]
MTSRRAAPCFIVPPHMLRAIAENGSPGERRDALATLLASERFRTRRQLVAGLPLMTPAGEKRRTIFDAHHGTSLPGRLARSEGQGETGDATADEAYDGAGATFDLYFDAWGRNSVDDRGMRLDSSVHYGSGYDNAFWNGTQMVYGDGDGKLFTRFTVAIDVIGHELTHGVTAHEANLEYQDQPGALNESISDVFGSLVKQRALQQTAISADWLIGAGLFTKRVAGMALRSLETPGTAYDDPVLGKDPQPGHMSDYVETSDDDGGVHINSGIPNRAFYLAATAIGGFAWEKAGRIWYVALRDRFRKTTDFAQAARLTAAVAEELYGKAGREAAAVRDAWSAVGLPAA